MLPRNGKFAIRRPCFSWKHIVTQTVVSDPNFNSREDLFALYVLKRNRRRRSRNSGFDLRRHLLAAARPTTRLTSLYAVLSEEYNI
jgi:hypothetical protein